MNIIKVRKKFLYDSIELRIVDTEEPYLNCVRPLNLIRVLAPNGGVVPLNIQGGQTLKAIVAETIALLDGFKARGADIKEELTKEI